MGGDQAELTGPDLRQGVAADAINEGDMLLGHADGEPVLLARSGGELFAVGAQCAHYGGPLAEGLVVDGTIRCPWHHAAFNLRTGESLRPPALGNIPCWKVQHRDGKAFVLEKSAESARLSPAASARRSHDSAPDSVVILGAGAAGGVAAETLRRDGYTGPITIIEGGPSGPYDRPNLSKDYLAGQAPEEWIPLRPQEFYADNDIELVLERRATAIDAATRTIRLDDGTSRTFDALLIATGAAPIRLEIPNADERVHYLRSLADSRSIIDAANKAKCAVVLGASFIGLEVAASLRTRGLDVVVVAPESHPLARVLGTELGDFIRTLHEEHGVTFRLGQIAAAIDETTVTLQNGERLKADLVVAGIGVRPNTALAESAGIATDRGILVDEYLETSVPGIYAAGDVARWPDPQTGERIRVEHWVVAQRQAQTAARNMLAGRSGNRNRFDAVPFFWSNHYDVSIHYVGHAVKWDRVDIDGSITEQDCKVTYRVGDRALAVATISRDRASLAAELAMERRMEPVAA